MAYRQRKAQLLHLLRSTDPNTAFAAIGAMPAAQVISPLFGLLCHGNPLVRWRAVDAMG
ncbi:MAG: HEAT repeat domain-containing protein, partial [Desulfatitalea sp.]|nr:HEAT repeat domain-containing protein [Desulfatitalea sp.]